MRSEPMALRAPPPGLCFAETPMRPLCVSFHAADIDADLWKADAEATRRVTRLHDLPEPTPPEPVILRIRVD
jgi:hypothetical protein